jgi:hypothetical protein
MVNAIIPTLTVLTVTYGAGATNSAMGGFFTGSLEQRIRRILERIKFYETMKRECANLEKPEKEDSDILLDSRKLESIAKPIDPKTTPTQKTVDKIIGISDDNFTTTLISKHLTQLKDTLRTDRANQLSSAAQMAMGVGQIAVATSAIGQATAIVAKAVTGFSFISSILYLGASVYGLGAAVSQLFDNRQKQAEINLAIQTLSETQNGPELDPIRRQEIEILSSSLEMLQTEEALLVQQRNSQAINSVAALMSIAALALFTAGTQGVGPLIYYALLAGSVLLPLIALGYSTSSMNESKYANELAALLAKLPSITKTLIKKANSEVLEDYNFLIARIINFKNDDFQMRQDFNNLLDTLKKELEQPTSSPEVEKERLDALNDLFNHLLKLHEGLIRDDLFCRLKVAGMSAEEILKHIATQNQTEKLTETLAADKEEYLSNETNDLEIEPLLESVSESE